MGGRPICRGFCIGGHDAGEITRSPDCYSCYSGVWSACHSRG
ncbi:MAG: hypothetical protein JNK33_00355 [Candidatus Doudnabacteria bacterium]|nr:hypothetical protein [Candidatus Doudnabacteria bacterium]